MGPIATNRVANAVVVKSVSMTGLPRNFLPPGEPAFEAGERHVINDEIRITNVC